MQKDQFARGGGSHVGWLYGSGSRFACRVTSGGPLSGQRKRRANTQTSIISRSESADVVKERILVNAMMAVEHIQKVKVNNGGSDD